MPYSTFNKLLLFLTTLSLSACNVSVKSENTETPAPLVITVTLPSTSTLRLSETAPSLLPQATVAPVDGVTITQLNVRVEPSTASEVLGTIGANTNIKIVGKDPDENWWQIIYETGPDRRGWVTAQYVETANKLEVPIIGGGVLNTQSGNPAVVIQQLNNRNGPGTSFDSLGILNANDIVNLVGKNNNGTWLQIDYIAGPNSKGWVNSGFIKMDTTMSLPIVSNTGDVIGTGTPGGTPLPPTPTIVHATIDFDSAVAPIKSVVFSHTGTNALIYTGDISAPNGDAEDWIAFTPYDNVVFIDIQCKGSNSIRVELKNIEGVILCDQPPMDFTVLANTESLIHINIVHPGSQLTYTKYTITIKENP